MPKVTYFKKPPKDPVRQLIKNTLDNQDLTQRDLAAKINMCENTLGSRLNSPRKFKLEELLQIGRCLDIPIEELRQAIRY